MSSRYDLDEHPVEEVTVVLNIFFVFQFAAAIRALQMLKSIRHATNGMVPKNHGAWFGLIKS